jgi:hypothetical protein
MDGFRRWDIVKKFKNEKSEWTMKTYMLSIGTFLALAFGVAHPTLAVAASSNPWDWLVGCYKTVAYNGASYQPIDPKDQIVTRISQITSQRFFYPSNHVPVSALQMEFGDKANGTITVEIPLGQDAAWMSSDVFGIKFKDTLYDATWKNTMQHEFEARFTKKSTNEMVVGYVDRKEGTTVWFRVVTEQVDCHKFESAIVYDSTATAFMGIFKAKVNRDGDQEFKTSDGALEIRCSQGLRASCSFMGALKNSSITVYDGIAEEFSSVIDIPRARTGNRSFTSRDGKLTINCVEGFRFSCSLSIY